MRLMIAALLCSSALFAADPFVGTWKLNAEKSKGLTPDLLKSVQTAIKREAAGPDAYRTTMYRTTGEPTTQTVRLDGKDQDNSRKGDAGKFTAAVQRIDTSHIHTVFKKNGKEYQQAEWTVLRDGKTETYRVWGTDRTSGKPIDVTLVYEKQE